jgi:hypothetical protein
MNRGVYFIVETGIYVRDVTWILAKKSRRKDILKSVCMQHRTILTQNIPRKEGNQSYQTGNVYDLVFFGDKKNLKIPKR